MQRSCCAPSPGAIPWIRLPPTFPVPDYVAELEKPVRGLKIGVAKEYFGEGLDAEVRKAVEDAIQKLAKLGCEVVPVSLPHTEVRHSDLLHRRDRGGLVEPGAL